MTRLLFGIVIGACGLALLVRFVAQGARRNGWAIDRETGDSLPQPDPYVMALARQAQWN